MFYQQLPEVGRGTFVIAIVRSIGGVLRRPILQVAGRFAGGERRPRAQFETVEKL